jgi:hypothetical protein
MMIGFYVIRKLIESQKLPSALVSTKLSGRKFPNNGADVHLMNTHRFYEHYDFENGKTEKFDLRFLVNQIIHSYIFSPVFDVNENDGEMELFGIHFCSDDQRNKWIFELKLSTVIALFDKVGNGNVTKASLMYDMIRKDYRILQGDESVPIPANIKKLIKKQTKRK